MKKCLENALKNSKKSARMPKKCVPKFLSRKLQENLKNYVFFFSVPHWFEPHLPKNTMLYSPVTEILPANSNVIWKWNIREELIRHQMTHVLFLNISIWCAKLEDALLGGTVDTI